MKKALLLTAMFCLIATLVFALPVQQGKTLTWDPPTTNNDGTPLTDLAGYKIYWKSTAGDSYTDAKSKSVGNVTTVTIESVTGSSTAIYYFVATAYDSANNESNFSNEVRNVLPLAPGVPGAFQLLVTL